MAKRTTTPALMLNPREPGTPAHRWLCTALRAEILEGRLRPGARLPATRDLAGQYGLSRGTIVSAFEQLKAEGYLEGTVGSGTYVNKILPDELLQVPLKARAPRAAPRPRRRALSDFGERARPVPPYTFSAPRAFRANQPALDLFPTALWAQVAGRRLRRASANLLLGCDPLGYRPLQEAVAEYLRTSRGVKCTPEQIAIVSGVQEALDLTARLLLNPGDRVCMEDPGYVGAAATFEACGARITPVRVDAEGMVLPPAKPGGARLAYVTPSHQFPLGISMSLPRRLALLEWARQAGAMIFEDDYDGEFRYSGRPVPALQGLDRQGLVLYSGSFSKVLFPSIRLGYLVVPPDLVDAFAAVKSVTSRHAGVPDQAVLCEFIAEGHFGRHVRRMREIYAERLAVLQEGARRRLGGLLEISGIDAGLQTAGWLVGTIDGETAARAAAGRGVEVTALSVYSRGPVAREGLHLGFAAVDPREIRRGVEELAVALETEREEPLSRSVDLQAR
ncbi:MAG TPA: PLP-dependent aminotransferase family protein [Thermoanaerobaculia bacterium]|nr:PLP-dependent aminotransferase family protein [Thermoanaerobaculia bacterium]